MKHLALALALAVAAPAQADVVYNWIPETGVAYEGAKMVFDDSGRNEYGIYHDPICDNGWPDDYYNCKPLIDPDSPLLLFQFGYLNIKPRTGEGYIYGQANMDISPTSIWMDTSFVHMEAWTDDTGLMTIANLTWDGTPPVYGITGRWVKEQASAVPLPGTLALLGIGLLAITARRRTTR